MIQNTLNLPIINKLTKSRSNVSLNSNAGLNLIKNNSTSNLNNLTINKKSKLS